ncbi:conserved protein of unknown function [Ralstonia solanacearum CMR15]|nr:conserved protein of unknown function [Ralstonia solanacearum CMR15]
MENPVTTALSTRNEFGAQETTTALVETSATAIAAQSKAMVEARYIMAMQRPRNWDQVRQDTLRECRRPTFANSPRSYYRKPIGKGVEGLGIGFVEVAIRHMRNILVEQPTIFEDAMKELVRVRVTDLEANTTYELDVKVSKTVERSKPMDDGSYFSMRLNSYNKPVYTVSATDDDLLNKRGALISKAVRTLGLRMIPGDIQDEAIGIILHVRMDEAARDPSAERKRIADAFADIGVRADDLVAYLGHPLDTCSPHELVDLRGIYGAIKDGEATWKSVMENKAEQNSNGENSGGDPKQRPACSAESFDKKNAGWRKQVESGAKTPNDLIAMIETKETLNDEQKMEIASWVVKPEGQ